MAVPRPILLALIGVALIGATFMAMRNSHDKASSSSPPIPKAAATKDPVTKVKASPAAKPTASKAAAPAAKPAQPAKAAAAKPAEHAARAKAPAKHHKSSSLAGPAGVARAIAAKKIVVLGFFQPGADDDATKASLAALKNRHWASVFSEKIGNVGKYGPIVGSLNLSQAPSLVIIDKSRHARVVEGYIDAETLAQEVDDLRR